MICLIKGGVESRDHSKIFVVILCLQCNDNHLFDQTKINRIFIVRIAIGQAIDIFAQESMDLWIPDSLLEVDLEPEMVGWNWFRMGGFL